MTKEESLVKKLAGKGKAGRRDDRIFAYAVSLGRKQMFQEGTLMEEILVTKSIYPEAGRQYGKSPKAAARQIERIGNLLWDRMTPEEREEYLGETERHLAPKEMVLHLGYYCEYGKSYYAVEEEWYKELFEKKGKQEEGIQKSVNKE